MWGIMKTALLLAPALACGNPLHHGSAARERTLVDVESELAALKYLHFQSNELRRMIVEKEIRVAEALGRRPQRLWESHVDLFDCDTVSCVASNMYRKVHAAASAFHGLLPHCEIVLEDSGPFETWDNKSRPGHGNHSRPGHGPGRGNHTDGNGTHPHPPPPKRPHPPPPHPHPNETHPHPCPPPPPHPPKWHKNQLTFLHGVMMGFFTFFLMSVLRRRHRSRRGGNSTCEERRAAFMRRWHNPEGCILSRMMRRSRAEAALLSADDEKLALMQHYHDDKNGDPKADHPATYRVAAALTGEMVVVQKDKVLPK